MFLCLHKLLVLAWILMSNKGIQCSENSHVMPSNCTINKFKIPLQFNVMKTIFQFSCHSNTMVNPLFPTLPNSYPKEYNELDLSPNFFNVIPSKQICPYKYVQVLDLSSNLISNLTGMFDLKCLTSLSQIDLSNNLIEGALSPNHFDDIFAAQLQSLNLSMNRLTSIETKTFLNRKGDSRFLNLRYINLANNLIKEFDILWPLLLPSPSMLIDLKRNPIDTLTNQLGLSYDDLLLNNPVIEYRYLDATDNNLTHISDSNLLQYGLSNSTDFEIFLLKIANYDLRSVYTAPRLFCYCDHLGQMTVDWYRNISSNIINSRKYPIFELTCSNFNEKMFIFDFPCIKTTTKTTSTTTTTTTSTTSTTSTTKTLLSTKNILNTLLDVPSNLPQLSLKNFTSQNTSLNRQIEKSFEKSDRNADKAISDLYYLLFLIIPGVLFLILIFVCCIGRCCQVCCFNSLSCSLCPCFRPNDNAAFTGKLYDMTICYSEYEEQWLNEEFMTQLSQYDRGFKIHKLKLGTSSRAHQSLITYSLGEEQKRILTKSKRIILMLSEKFLKNEWSNRNFREFIKRVYLTEKETILVFINLGSMSNEKTEVLIKEIKNRNVKTSDNTPVYIHEHHDSLTTKCSDRMTFMCGLKKAEVLNWVEDTFWKNFNYIMPRHAYGEVTKISHSASGRRLKRNSIDVETNSYPFKPTPAPTRSHEPKIRKTRPNNRRIEVPNLPINFTSDTTSDVDVARMPSVRQVIVPIPEEMRIKLGQYARDSQQQETLSGRVGNHSNRENSGRNTPHRSVEKRLTELDSVSKTYEPSEFSRRHKLDSLPRIDSQKNEMPGVSSAILANFEPAESVRKNRKKERYLDDSVLDNNGKTEEKSDDSI